VVVSIAFRQTSESGFSFLNSFHNHQNVPDRRGALSAGEFYSETRLHPLSFAQQRRFVTGTRAWIRIDLIQILQRVFN
jgi:hypothetical protein